MTVKNFDNLQEAFANCSASADKRSKFSFAREGCVHRIARHFDQEVEKQSSAGVSAADVTAGVQMVREFARLLKRGSGIAAFAALAAFAGKASAIAYVGSYDPLFTQDFANNSSWSGNVTIEVPLSCLPNTNVQTDVSGCSGFKLVSASVWLKNPDASLAAALGFPNTGSSLFDQGLRIVFGGGSYLYDVRFIDNTPAAINGKFDAPVYTTAFNALDSTITGTLFFLSFQEFTPVLSWLYLFGGGSSTLDGGPGTAKWTTETFQRVPEPSSLALLVLALGALGLFRVRKASAPARG